MEPSTDQSPEEVLATAMNRLRGKFLGNIEAHDLSPHTEATLKSVFKSMTYDTQKDLARILECDIVPEGQCHCGCGGRTGPYQSSRASKGQVKGQPQKFIHGHHPPKQLANFIVNDDSGCWIWQGLIDHNGYGVISANSGLRMAHRFIYELVGREIPEGSHLHHECHNRRCVNPGHLSPIDPQSHVEVTRQRYASQLASDALPLLESLDDLDLDDSAQDIVDELLALMKSMTYDTERDVIKHVSGE